MSLQGVRNGAKVYRLVPVEGSSTLFAKVVTREFMWDRWQDVPPEKGSGGYGRVEAIGTYGQLMNRKAELRGRWAIDREAK